MRISTSQLNQNAVNSIETAEAQVAQTQAQLSTGKRINTPADDPVGAVQLLQLNNIKSQNTQYLANGTSATTSLGLENTALTTATNTLQSIRDLVVEANSGSETPADLKDIATQISSLEGQLQGAANSQDTNGNYMFAGFSSDTQPFVRGTGGAMSYVGDDGANSVELNGGTSVQTGDPGSSVFMNVPNGNGTFITGANGGNTGTGVVDVGSVIDAPDLEGLDDLHDFFAPYTITFQTPTTYTVTDSQGNAVPVGTDANGNPITTGTYDPTDGSEIEFDGIEVGISGAPAANDSYTVTPAGKQSVFDSIDKIVSLLNGASASSAGKAQLASALGNSLQQIDNASNQILNVQASVGARINLVSSSANSVTTNNTTISAQISTVGDLDYAQASSDYSQQLVALQAAEQSYVAIENLSLFKVLAGG